MLLRSFHFTQQLSGEMLDVLFKDLPNYHGEFDYSIELIEAALEGRIDIEKPFNLFGWCKTVRDGNFQTELKRLKKQEYLIEDDDEDKTGVKASSLVEEHDDYEVFIDNEELLYTVKKIRALNNEIIVAMGIDLIFCMRQAVRGIPQAIMELSNICKEYTWIAEYVQIILSSGISFEELFPEETIFFRRPEAKKQSALKMG